MIALAGLPESVLAAIAVASLAGAVLAGVLAVIAWRGGRR